MTIQEFIRFAHTCMIRGWSEAERAAYERVYTLARTCESTEQAKEHIKHIMTTEEVTPLEKHIFTLALQREEPCLRLGIDQFYIRGKGKAQPRREGSR